MKYCSDKLLYVICKYLYISRFVKKLLKPRERDLELSLLMTGLSNIYSN